VQVSRTNIDLDDALVARVMERYGLKTKKEAVDLALRRLIGGTMTREEALAMEGSGWDGDLQMLRRDRMKQLWGIEPEERP
jgi:Arc/MetJ family transcription regulator